MNKDYIELLQDENTGEFYEPYATIACKTEEDFKNIQKALEKQVAKKPIQQSTDEKTHHKCVCGTILRTDYTDIRQGYIPAYCSHCGQKLDRSEVE